MTGVLAILTLAAIGCVTGWLLAWMWTAAVTRLIPWNARRHRSCTRRHPGRTHEEWLRVVVEPVEAEWFARHGIERKRP